MVEVNDSILDTTKKALSMEPDYTAFDSDIIMHINSTFFVLQQLGIGPAEGFTIEGSEETWAQFMGIDNYNAVRSYMYLKIRLLFDPPANSFSQEAMKKQAEEYEWRLNVHRENLKGVTNA